MSHYVKFRYSEQMKKKVEGIPTQKNVLAFELATQKILLQKQILRPVWTGGIQIWILPKTAKVIHLSTFEQLAFTEILVSK